MRLWKAILLIGSMILLCQPVFAEQIIIKGAGGTFPKSLYDKWGRDYEIRSGVKLEYEANSSGFGIKQIEAGAVDFGASDLPLSDEELKQYNLVQFPIVIGAVVPIVNLPDVAPNELRLTGSVLADIYLGKIKVWNDRAIVSLNPAVKLTNLPILVVHRLGPSGVSSIFSQYLSAKSEMWKNQVGNPKEIIWPVGTAEKTNEDVASFVKKNPGSIAYVEYAYTIGMSSVMLENKSGHFVQPSTRAFTAVSENIDWEKSKNFNAYMIDQQGVESWPIVGSTYIILRTRQNDAAHALEVLKFFDWCFQFGDKSILKLYYVPLPYKLNAVIRDKLKNEIKDVQGRPVLSLSQNTVAPK